MWLTFDVVFLVAALLLHSVACRLGRSGNTVIRFLIVGGIAGLALTAILLHRYGLSPQLVAGVLVYAFLCELYIFLFTLAISSVSANLLLNLSFRDLTQKEIDRKYDSALMVTQRIERMIATGLIEETPQGDKLTARGRRLFVLFERLRRFFRHTLVPNRK